MKIGGQAVMEGVMMRSEKKIAIAVRLLKERKIKVKVKKIKEAPRIFKLPLARGIYVLIDSLITGMGALKWSANQNLERKEKIKKKEMGLTLAFSLIIGLGLFLGLPYLTTKLILGKGIWFGLMEGILRAGLIVGYIRVIGFSKEVQRLFQYHGAEHKVVNCYEAGEEVDKEKAKKYSTLHARCGTAFIFLVLILSILVFSFLEVGWMRIVWKIILIPVIAGASYEILKLGDKFKDNFLVKGLIWPGLMLQKMTTREPDEKQIEVAIKAFEKVVR